MLQNVRGSHPLFAIHLSEIQFSCAFQISIWFWCSSLGSYQTSYLILTMWRLKSFKMLLKPRVMFDLLATQCGLHCNAHAPYPLTYFESNAKPQRVGPYNLSSLILPQPLCSPYVWIFSSLWTSYWLRGSEPMFFIIWSEKKLPSNLRNILPKFC